LICGSKTKKVLLPQFKTQLSLYSHSPAQTPFERVLASGQGDSRRVAELKKLRSLLDPFELSRSIDRKLESIYALANRRLSPKAITSRGATAVQKTPGGKVQKKELFHHAWKSRKERRIPTFAQPRRRATVTSLMSRQQRSRLHS
jgi:hypothetical protein